ncbi:DUF6931 family protein [Sphingomonas endolithica]|uniref:DUF6931 family protein n=1 Tax=Sphingomonas endolithica TaxID=2972485 RepID=UPI0021AE6817|nr:hypothetical protein [Sphingomonas sp. ZFBP2030]
MNPWPAIKLTQARQVALLLDGDLDESELPDDAIDVQAGYVAIKGNGSAADAVDYIGHALPRLEAVAWAAQVLDRESRVRELPVRDRLALDHALRWLDEPSDANRRATQVAALAANPRSAEHRLGLAVYYSGGSIADPGMPPLLAPPEACLRYAVAAVKSAAFRTDAPATVLGSALALAERAAEGGLPALTAA